MSFYFHLFKKALPYSDVKNKYAKKGELWGKTPKETEVILSRFHNGSRM